ncbi:hypothetical protein THARTR1_06043 [Trichoderma harzianum]|uniref:Uncharacterized protein n=1 Tax=Trichoderma harzianum TaxID=5544 RepID=A0A2K0U6F1_TRIHA|nr:hypothetical protein THARTR1_06043 [Trichoderma harzianum]
MDQGNVYSHSRSRTTSSSVFPSQAQHQHPPPMLLSHQMSSQQFNRRSPSVSTFSNSSIQPPAAYRTSSNSDLRRSISNRSFGQPQASGYVALLRKQKATVWCDRAQYEDPRILAQQRAAKMRANLEVSGANRGSGSAGSSSGGRTSTGISATTKVAAKIRHHGKLPVVGYANENHVGVGGVPMRLSATEVEGESSEEEFASSSHHRRTGSSGRSSIGSSTRRNVSYRASGGTVTGTGSQSGRRWSPGDTPERTGSLVEQPEDTMPVIDDAASGRAQSTHSGSSAERADNVGELGAAPRLASKSLMHSALTREKSVKSPEELKRRGSVDERTATLTSQRLYIANPD